MLGKNEYNVNHNHFLPVPNVAIIPKKRVAFEKAPQNFYLEKFQKMPNLELLSK